MILTPLPLNNAVVTPSPSINLPENEPPPPPGTPGQEVWTFKALKEGSSIVNAQAFQIDTLPNASSGGVLGMLGL